MDLKQQNLLQKASMGAQQYNRRQSTRFDPLMRDPKRANTSKAVIDLALQGAGA